MLTLRPGAMEYELIVPHGRAQFQIVSAFLRPITVSCPQLRPARASLAPLRAQRFEFISVPESRVQVKIEIVDGKSPLFVNVVVDNAQNSLQKRRHEIAVVQQSVNASYEKSRTQNIPRHGVDYAKTVELVEKLQDIQVDDGQQHCLNVHTRKLIGTVLKAIGKNMVNAAIQELISVAEEYAALN